MRNLQSLNIFDCTKTHFLTKTLPFKKLFKKIFILWFENKKNQKTKQYVRYTPGCSERVKHNQFEVTKQLQI